MRGLCKMMAFALIAWLPAGAIAADLTLGMSWYKFAEERWKFDEAGIKSVLDERGVGYVSADANFSVEKQVADIENLLTRGADVLMVMSSGGNAGVTPVVKRAMLEGVPVVAYDQIIADPDVVYVSFDARMVGKQLANGMLEYAPEGRYVLLNGDYGDPNAHQFHAGMMDVLKPKIDAGDIQIVAEQYIQGWKTENAKAAMEQILTAQNNKVDAVIAMNDSMAAGVIEALRGQGLDDVPVSGQDGGTDALNRIARGVQTYTIWKNASELGKTAAKIALALANDEQLPYEMKPFDKGLDDTVIKRSKLIATDLITRDNLQKTVKAGWATREDICAGVSENPPPLCQ